MTFSDFKGFSDAVFSIAISIYRGVCFVLV